MKRLVIFASGSGTNAENLIRYFHAGNRARVVAVFTNNANAGVIERAKNLEVPSVVFSKSELSDRDSFDKKLEAFKPDLILLAGFLLLLPAELIKKFPNRILNIHPALLPKFGGKGMYGNHVHRAVLDGGEKEHGVTVHMVNEKYDEGKIIAQEAFDISPEDNLESVLLKIHEVEFRIYPKAVDIVLNGEK